MKEEPLVKYDHLLVEKKTGAAWLTINRPEAMNALHPDTHAQLQHCLSELDRDPEVRVVIITGAGRAFSAGGDLKWISSHRDDPIAIAGYGQMFHDTFFLMEHMSKVNIAMINGHCLAGGLELAEACDLAYAADDVNIGDQHASVGLIPSGGGSQRLPRLIPLRVARELLFTGDWMSAKEAERWGIINKAVPRDKLREYVEGVANKLVQRSPIASKHIKYAVNRGLQVDLYTGIEIEKAASRAHFQSQDAKEGLDSFMEKRKPNFPGK
jgi:enoyl-CoA hydratase/carnithine racemase